MLRIIHLANEGFIDASRREPVIINPYNRTMDCKYPADYGNSGVVTFIVNHDGVVYQKDLGENTAQEAAKITGYDPNETWEKTQ